MRIQRINLFYFILVIAIAFNLSTIGHSAPEDFQFQSIRSQSTRLPSFRADFASINNNGTVLYSFPSQNTFDPELLKFDGTTSNFFMTITAFNSMIMNDQEQIATTIASQGGAVFDIVRINPDTTIDTFATLNGNGTADFLGISNNPLDINNSGDVASGFQNNDSSFSIELFSDTAPTQRTILQADANIFNLSAPSINDQIPPVVAFKAQEPFPLFVSVFTGTGLNGITNEGPNPLGGNSGTGPSINNSGLVLDQDQ